MIKLFIGGKGSGKTKTLIEMVNNATQASKGNVVCIEKGDKLTHSITYKARLIDTDDYCIVDASSLFGFIANGIVSTPHFISSPDASNTVFMPRAFAF